MVKIFPRLTLRCPFEVVEVGGAVSAVSVSNGQYDYNGVIELKNEPAQFMFKKVQEGISLPELIKVCMEHYASPVEDVGPKVVEFLDSLGKQGLLIADPQHGVRYDDGK